MLPLLVNQLLVSLSKSNIAVVYRKAFGGTVLGEKHITWKPEEGDAWQQVIYKLERTLDALDIPKGTQLSVTLSADMVRYLTLKPQNMRLTHDEKVAYASASYREIFGFESDDWLIKCHDAPPDQPMLASAIDRGLFDAIEVVANKYAFKLKSVQPYLMTVMNALHDSLKGADTMFAVVEMNRIVIINLQKGYCSQVRAYPRTRTWQKTLSNILARETLLGDEGIREILVYAPAQGKPAIPFADDWLIKTLNIQSKHLIAKPQFAMLEALA